MTEPTDKNDEQPLDEYLKGNSSVSRQYRQLPGEDVPPSLDRLVLRQAAEAVKRPSRPAWMRWTAPLAVAASTVLVVSIVIESGLRDETIVSAPTMQAQRAAAAQAPVETRMIEESKETPPPMVAAPPPAAPIADAPADANTFARQRSAPPPPAPAPAQELKRAAQPARDEAAGAVLQEQVAKAERQKSALESAAREQEKSATQRAMRADQGQIAGSRESVEKPEPKAVLSYSRPISAIPVNTATIQRANTDPEAWLKEIRQLRIDNKKEEADREWRRFREAFPNYEVAETDAARESRE